MASTKKQRKNKCLKCGISLTSKNWPVYDQNKSYYVCKLCRKRIDKKSHQADPDYSKKQNKRYRMKRSAVILAYGNACCICGEDDYTKLTINGNVNYLYDNIVQKIGHQVKCYNCLNGKPYKNEYAEAYRKKIVKYYGGCCKECNEDKVERLTLTKNKKLLCYNCKYSAIALKKYPPEPEKQAG
jgi:hypothetical protein